MFLSVITKNVNWEILAENLVTFKRWNGMGQYRGNCLKRGGLDSFSLKI